MTTSTLNAVGGREADRVRQLHALMDSVPAVVWIMEDMEGTRITGSRLSYELLRLKPGVNSSVIAPEDERPQHFKVLHGGRELRPDELPVQKAAWENCEIRGSEIDIVFNTGEQVNLFGNAVPIRDSEGRAIGSIAAFLDVTELKATQAHLRRSLSRLQLTLDVAKAGAWDWDAATDSRHWTPDFYELFGLDPALPPSQELAWKAIHPEDVDRFEECSRVWRQGQPNRFEFRVIHPRKGTRWLEIFGRPLLNADGTVNSAIGVVLDITERKQVEQELEHRVELRTQELVAANEEMEGFTYNVAHDLRAPLRAIVANSRMLLDDLGETLDSEHRQMLERQSANANKLGHLIDDLLKISRLTRQDMSFEIVDISALAQAEAKAQATSCHEFIVDPQMRALGDEKLLRLLFQNLMGNACKFSPEGGTIHIGKAELESGETAFFVRDRGIGFDMAYVSKLFQPFERLVRDNEIPGTGIGLASVKRVVRRHGGRVWAESDGEGCGATFCFTLK